MSSRYTQLAVHIVLVTKFRRNLIAEWFEARFWSQIWETARELGIHVYAVGGIENHIHILYEQPANMTLGEVAKAFKGTVSRWVATDLKRDFEWQPGYAAFHVNQRGIPRVVRYIHKQREHHRSPKVNQAFNKLVRAMDETRISDDAAESVTRRAPKHQRNAEEHTPAQAADRVHSPSSDSRAQPPNRQFAGTSLQ